VSNRQRFADKALRTFVRIQENQMPAKSTKSSEATKPAAAAAKKRSTTPRGRATTRRRRPQHSQIAERAYFIHLQEGSSDEMENWLRAERELKAA
jgi:Protein of unknown function (DUF2934)